MVIRSTARPEAWWCSACLTAFRIAAFWNSFSVCPKLPSRLISTSLKAGPNSLEDPPEADPPEDDPSAAESLDSDPAEGASLEAAPAEEASPAEASPDEDPAAEDSSEDDSPEDDPDEEDSLEEDSLEEDSLEEDLGEGDPLEDEDDEQPDSAAAAQNTAASKALDNISSRRSTAPVLRFLATLPTWDFTGPARLRQRNSLLVGSAAREREGPASIGGWRGLQQDSALKGSSFARVDGCYSSGKPVSAA